ncbi:hypothetical protein OGAPHI_007106 [Ogataea philodendri]|uniref:JAB1/MPN/MOV34 metalloenzyme domain-containing protein n=1 Tax=Ogataea philodendri TaxID=1378263 RepID=A0A9P8NVY6_9ASCO|nr:uncharacterized protein OGAPHI_007106 [Ogataea philodendri]KAH3660520.1 hypothetical protein OGAPHI_007106 [Ogataea philodendri]
MSYSVEISASVALKISKIGADTYPETESGALFGLDAISDETAEKKHTIIKTSHAFQFPSSYTNDEIFNLKTSNSKYQSDVLAKLNITNSGVKILGWFLTTNGGKFVSQSLIESIINLQNHNVEENRDSTPVIVLVFDALKSMDGLLNLKAFKLSESFMKAWKSDQRFVSKNLYESRLTYRNIFEELPLKIKNNHLSNLKVQELSPKLEQDLCLELTGATLASMKLTVENLNEGVDNFNHTLGNLNYYQRNLSREVAKVNQWKQQIKHDNDEKLKLNPSAKLTETEKDWAKHFKLPIQPSKYENLVMSSLINNYCNSLETDGSIEQVKTTSIEECK